jgi:hypothetical protein
MFSEQVILSLAVMVFAVMVLILVYVFGRTIFFGGFGRNDEYWDYFFRYIVKSFPPGSHLYSEIFKGSVEPILEKRNDFWSVFGQLYISIFLIAAITVLLLTKTINADAGLPLLSAIVAFAVARTSDKTRDRELPTERREGEPR